MTILSRWNAAVAHWNKASWGGIGMEADNYYWGYLRNSLLWGLATSGENPEAQGFIDAATKKRFEQSFLPTRRRTGAAASRPKARSTDATCSTTR